MRTIGRLLICLSAAVALTAGPAPSSAGGARGQEPVSPGAGHVAHLAIDYPADGTVFPPELPAPLFLFRDSADAARRWTVNVVFADGPALRLEAAVEPMKIGEIDPRCVTATNTPTLTPQQERTRTWRPDPAAWQTIKSRSARGAATLAIEGYTDEGMAHPVSRGQVTLRTSKDPVGAPIFYRDVPLMPTAGEQGVIRPIPQTAIGLIKWRLRSVGESESRTVMENLPTCANCHSFSLDGKTLGLDVDGPQNDKGLYALVPLKRESAIRNEDVIKWSSYKGKLGGKLRAAFMSQVSPDGRHVVTTIEDPTTRPGESRADLLDKYYSANFSDYRFLQVFFPTRGILAWYSRESGMLKPLPGADDPRFVHTDGVWSPDGKWVVFARALAKPPYPEGWTPAEYANDPRETQIQYDLYRVPFNGGLGGKPERIEGASQNGMSNNFPKVSPDGRWIVFVKCRNGQLMRPDSELYIVPFGGGKARRMNCNTPLMNSWHSFAPNGRWMVFSSKSRSPFTQMYLTHIDEKGNDSPPVLVENATAANRAVNIPEFVNIPADGLERIDTPAMEFFRVFDRAADLGRNNRIDEAIAEWQKAVELNPEEGRAFFNLALALERAGRADDAIPAYRKAIDLDSSNSSAYSNLAVALARGGKLDEAIETLRGALTVSPRDAKAHHNLGAALFEKGQLEESISHSRLALQIEPDYADAHNSLAAALAMTGKVPEAIIHLEQAVALRPEAFEFRYNLGRFLAAESRFPEAVTQFEHAVVISRGREPLSFQMLGAMYFEVGKYVEAAQAVRKALELVIAQGNRELEAELRARLAEYEAKLRR